MTSIAWRIELEVTGTNPALTIGPNDPISIVVHTHAKPTLIATAKQCFGVLECEAWIAAARERTRGQAPAMKKWWFRQHGNLWQEWALVQPGGYVVIYDESGRVLRRASYGSRFRAAAALRLKGFRRLKRKELQAAAPPEID
jgi:hypothetical protein